MQTSDNAIRLLKNSEGLRLVAYPDPDTLGDPWGIGYGQTGPGIVPGMTITVAQAEELLRDALQRTFEPMVSAASPRAQGHHDAFVLFAYNMGGGARGVKDGFNVLKNGNLPTFRRLYAAGDDAGCADQFPGWANPPLPGLIVRRARERNVFLGRPWEAIPDANVVAAQAANMVPA